MANNNLGCCHSTTGYCEDCRLPDCLASKDNTGYIIKKGPCVIPQYPPNPIKYYRITGPSWDELFQLTQNRKAT